VHPVSRRRKEAKHLRVYHSTWQRNQRAPDFATAARDRLKDLDVINLTTEAKFLGTKPPTMPAVGPQVALVGAVLESTVLTDTPRVVEVVSVPEVGPASFQFAELRQAAPMDTAPIPMLMGPSMSIPTIVGGQAIGGAPPSPNKKRKQRGGDKRVDGPRKRRRCMLCVKHGDEGQKNGAEACPGSAPRGSCLYFVRQVPLKLMFKIVISTILLERYPSLWVSYCGPQARTSLSHFWSAWIGFIVFKKHVGIQITEN
jgi:hypothetical protein